MKKLIYACQMTIAGVVVVWVFLICIAGMAAAILGVSWAVYLLATPLLGGTS